MNRSGKFYASEAKLVNLTGHDVNLGDRLIVPREPKPTRLLNERVRDGMMVLDDSGESIPIYRFDPEVQIVGLPEAEERTLLIVSPMVRKELTIRGISRPDVVSPYAVETREIDGEKVQCAKALAR